jgi:DSBA-like thioredoxin domain
MNVDFYFCPSCPFCWITSRWLCMVSNDRNINITWKPFSLAIKNDTLHNNADSKYAAGSRAAHRVLRVMLAAEKEKASLLDLYTEFGIQHFVVGLDYDHAMIKKILERKKLPVSLLKFADDEKLDAKIEASMKEAISIAGEDIGVPTIVFELKDGTKAGYFGPVLQDLPDKEESLRLWDGLSMLATDKSFYELKRSRPAGGPDVYSTAKC